MFGILSTIYGAIAASAVATAGGLAVAWRRSGLGRARRRAQGAVAPLRKEARAYRKAIDRWERRAAPEVRAFAVAQEERRLAGVPVESLRDAGASHVRWSALEEAGFRTLADVRGVSAPRLARVHGVGRKTARRVVDAAARVAERVAGEPPALPEAELGADELVLGERTLDLLEARAAGGDGPRLLAERAEGLEGRLADVRRGTSFWRWVTSPFRRADAARVQAEAHELAVRADGLVTEGLLEEARAGRERVRGWRQPRREAADVRRGFRDRYAECCALLEELFGRLGLRSAPAVRSGQGGLTDEVARRVEAFPLRAAGLRLTLRRYQEFGAKYVLAQERTILGDEMGLGKTLQALAAMVHRSAEKPRARFFVVAPAGLLVNWSREVEKCTPLAWHLLHGDELEASLARWVEEGGVAITSYATLRSTDVGGALASAGGGIDLCAVDEAHFVKNPAAGRTQAVRRLLERSELAVLLSGTPMENRPAEFLELIDAIRPQDAADLRSRNLLLDATAGSVRAFHQAVAKVYLRRNQKDVLTELPDRIEVEEWVEPSAEDRRAYEEQVAAGNFMGMRRAATLGRVDTPSAKLEHLAELLADHRESGRKVIVFSFFLDVLAACARRFDTVGTISGALGPAEKQELCDAFQAREGHAILLLQINAGGQGLNLQAASAVVLMEPQTKPSTEAQAVARAHRMGQTQRVIVHRLLARRTCDEAMLLVLAEKSELFDAYAKRSLVKEASPEARETSLARQVVEAEQARIADERAEGMAPATPMAQVTDVALSPEDD